MLAVWASSGLRHRTACRQGKNLALVEFAQLAQQLGRIFEARVFLTIAISEEPARMDLRRDLERLRATLAIIALTGARA